MRPVETLAAFGRYLAERGLRFAWPAHVRDTLADLAARLGHAL
jgi:hypothetical protein